MIPRRHARSLALCLCLAVSSSLPVHAIAQSTSALINEALDKQVALSLNTTLPNALKQIGDQTGVRIEADPVVYELLPWGDQTNITATIQNKTLRESLTALTRTLGLTWELGDNAVRLRPVDALARMGKRSTLQELKLLDTLAGTPIRLPDSRPTLRQVIEAVDAALLAGKTEFVVESRIAQPDTGGTVGGRADPLQWLIPVPRGASLAEALEAVSRTTPVTWYPWGKSVVLLPKEDQVRMLLQKPVTVRYPGVEVSQVLLELSKLSGVDFAIEPGAVQRITPEFRTVRLVVDNASVQQVLESLSASTGLGYVVTDRGVYIWNNSPIPGALPPLAGANAQGGGAGGGGGGGAMLVTIAEGMQLILRDADLPDDVRQFVQNRRATAVTALRQLMEKQGFKANPPKSETDRPDLHAN